MAADFEERWREAMASYQAAIVDYEAAAGKLNRALRGGYAATDIEISKEELARARVVEARRHVFQLLSEQATRRND